MSQSSHQNPDSEENQREHQANESYIGGLKLEHAHKTPNKFEIASVMIKFGGSFVQHIGHALQCADSENERKIRETWPEYLAQYEEMARTLKEWESQAE